MKDSLQDPENQLSSYDNACDPVVRVGEGKALPSTHPPRGVCEGSSSLLYLNGHNSDKKEKRRDNSDSQEPHESKRWSPKSKTAKKQKSLTQNVQYWADKLGVENLGFLTLTFKGNLRCKKEAQRRWNNLNRTIGRDRKFEVLVKVAEIQKRGAIHYHALVHIGQDIRNGFNWDAFIEASKAYRAKDHKEGRRLTRIYATSAKEHLRHLWGYLRTKCESHGFGRSELMPIHYPNNIGSYLGKYLNKDDKDTHHGNVANTQTFKGMRRVSYGRKHFKPANANFNWVHHPQGKPIFRHKLKQWAEYRGFKDIDDLEIHLGKNWSHHYYQEIMFDHVRLRREADGLPPIGERGWEPNLTTAVQQSTWKDYLERKSPEKSCFQIERKRLEAYRYHKTHRYLHE